MGKAKAHQQLPTNWDERELLRDKGQFWTPSWVAEAMVEYVSENTDLLFDPATGRGAFFEALMRLKKPKVSFLGTDVDPEVLLDKIYQNPACTVELRDYLKNPPKRKFKAISANPPYIRHHRVDKETKAFLKNLCARITGFAIDGRAGYHVYFLIQALSNLEKNGKLAFIMPADTCEGNFAVKLWQWISSNYCIEAVVTFDAQATPFPNVDTNAVVFLIKNTEPQESLYWVRAKRAYSKDLFNFIASGFKSQTFDAIDVTSRQLDEAIRTGLSRPEQPGDNFKYRLGDFAKVMRGIATGSNEFFFLTKQQIEELRIPEHFFKIAIGRTKDATGSILTAKDVRTLEEQKRPVYLLSIDKNETLPAQVKDYLAVGEKMGLPNLSLIKQRKPWYKMEKREVPPLLFAYLGRRNVRFIKNEANALPLTGFLCVYPIATDKQHIDKLWQALNHPDTLANLHLVGKSYGSGAIKVEPGKLSNLPIPEHIVEQFDLKSNRYAVGATLALFEESLACLSSS